MAVLPLSNTNVKLCTGIPFHSDYMHTRWFDSRVDQTAFFESRKTHDFTEMKFQRVEYGYQTRVAVGIETLRNVNYMYFNNGGRTYYCFVKNMEYNNNNMTIIHFDIDYIQTYMFDIRFKQSYVVREHPSGEINTLDEGLNYGDFMENVLVEKVKLFEGNKFLIVVCKEPLHDTSGQTTDNTVNDEKSSSKINPSVIGSPQPLTFYALPFNSDKMREDMGGYVTPSVTIDGGAVKFLSQPLTLLKEFYSNTDAVNNIVSMYITEYPGFTMDYQNKDDGFVLGNFNIKNSRNQKISVVKLKDKELFMLHVEALERTHFLSMTVKTNFMDVFTGHVNDPGNKLKQSPYTRIYLDDMKGNRVEYLPEMFLGNDLILNVKGGISHNNQITWGFENYSYLNTRYLGEQIVQEHAIVNSKPQDVAILNDALAAYMQGNKNSLKVKQDNIAINGLMGGLSSLRSGISQGMTGNIGGAVADTTMSLGAGMVGMQQEINGLNAQLKDISNVPPSISSMGANVHFDYSNKYDGVYIIYKQIKPEYRKRIADYLKMFGYKTNLLKTPNIKTRPYFNYIQTKGCNIAGLFNNEVITNVKRIFDNGITVWHVDDVGNYYVDNNTVRSG